MSDWTPTLLGSNQSDSSPDRIWGEGRNEPIEGVGGSGEQASIGRDRWQVLIRRAWSRRSIVWLLSLFRLLLRWSGGQVDYSRLARLSELSRPTVRAHVEALQIAHAVHLLPPFHGGGSREIVSRPKCYAFDTGFVTFEKGWDGCGSSSSAAQEASASGTARAT